MSENLPVPPVSQLPRKRQVSLEMIVLGWLLLQLAGLLIPALETPLVVGSAVPPERLAMGEMLAIQIIGGAMLFGTLMSSLPSSALVIFSSWVFLVLSAYLSAELHVWRIVGANMIVTSWLAGLGLWRSALRQKSPKMIGVAVATALAVGGPILWYIHAEFVVRSEKVNWSHVGAAGPLMAALAVLNSARFRAPWIFSTIFVLSGVAAFFLHERGGKGSGENGGH